MRRQSVFPFACLLLISAPVYSAAAAAPTSLPQNRNFPTSITQPALLASIADENCLRSDDADDGDDGDDGDDSDGNVQKIDNAPVDTPVLRNASAAGAPAVVAAAATSAPDSAESAVSTSWVQRTQNRLDQIWRNGTTDLYLTGYAWHNPAAYTAAKRRSFNDISYGGGLGKGLYDEDGDWHALYAMAFLDSHTSPEPLAGYAFQKIGRPSENTRLGIGYTAFLTSRKDILHRIPFPGVLPLVSAGYGKGTLFATYIPGGKGNGNVLFMFGKWTF